MTMKRAAGNGRRFDAGLEQRRVHADAEVVEVWVGPRPDAAVHYALPRLPQLAAPAKLAMTSEGGAGWLADVPRALDLHACEKFAGEALDAALDWLNAGCPQPTDRETHTSSVDEVEEVLDSLPWSWEPDGDCAYRIHAAEPQGAARLRVERVSAGGLRVSTTRTMPVPSASAMQALAACTLECNRRLRLARLSVAEVGNGIACITWDGLLPTGIPSRTGLEPIIRAVSFARIESLPVLAALATPAVAQAYLRLRCREPERGAAQGVDHAAGIVPAAKPGEAT